MLNFGIKDYKVTNHQPKAQPDLHRSKFVRRHDQPWTTDDIIKELDKEIKYKKQGGCYGK